MIHQHTEAALQGTGAPWKERFRVSKIVWSQVAEAWSDRGLVASNRSGKVQLHAWDVPAGVLRQLSDRPEGLLFGFIGGDGQHVYYLDDQGGNEVGHLVRVPFAGGEPEDVTPSLPPYATFGGAVSADGNVLVFSLADADGFALVAVDFAADGTPGEPRELYRSAHLFWPPVVSPDGDVAAIASTERSGSLHFSLLAFDTRSGERIGELWDGPETSVQPAVFARHADAANAGEVPLAAATNRSGFARPVIWHPRANRRHDVPAEGVEGDLAPLSWSEAGDQLLLMQTHRATHRLWTYDLANDALRALDSLPGSYNWGAYFGPGDEIFANWQDSTNPPQVIALDAGDGRRLRTVLPAGEAPPGRSLRSVTFTSSDGQEIQGWLGVPDGDGPFPAILYIHGGPEDVATDDFSPDAQAWLDHGFAYLTVNFRGSTTFGRAFQQKIWGDLGHWELEDVVAARDWLVRERIALPDQIFPSGWSYGGFMTLLALGKRPDLWAGGLAGIAVADWTMLYEDSSDVLKGYCAGLHGGTPDEKPAQYAASSPLTYVAQVRAPLLIIQGRNDTRTPARQVQVYVDRLRELGGTVELDWFESGHLGPFADVEQAIAHQDRMMRFADRVLGRVAGAVAG